MDCDPERIWKIVDSNRQSILQPRKHSLESMGLSDKLHEVYTGHPCDKGQPFRSAVNLLNKLDQSSAKPSFVLSLYDDTKGYSITLCCNNDDDCTTDDDCTQLYLPYEEDYILSYLDNQEVPPLFMEILNDTEYFRFHDGSVICEVRNYRDCRNGYYNTQLILHQDPESFCSATSNVSLENLCSQNEEMCVESHLVMSAQNPICLDPSTDVACVNNRLYYNKLKFNSLTVRKKAFACKRLRLEGIPSFVKPRQRYATIPGNLSYGRLSESWRPTKLKCISSDIIKEVVDDVSRLVPPIAPLHQTNSVVDGEDAPELPEVATSTLHESYGQSIPTDNKMKPSICDNQNLPVGLRSSKALPPLNIYQPAKALLLSNQLPKLHPLSNEQKLLLTNFRKTLNIQRSSPPLPSASMPQLHKID